MFLRLLAILPLGVLYGISDVLYFIMRYLWRYRLDTVRRNLRNAFPEMGAAERDALEKRFYRNFCDMFVETMKARSISRDEIRRRVRFTNMELLEREAARGQSLILLVAHQFNWEWLLLAFSVQAPYPLLAIYQPPHLRSFDRFLYATRTRLGAELVPQKQAMGEIRRRRHQLTGLGILADQTESGENGNYWTEFMNQPTAFSLNIQRLAQLTQHPVYFGRIQRTARGHYSVTWVELSRPPHERGSTGVLESYVQAVEEQIRARPDGWLWTNRRWKRPRPAGAQFRDG